MGRGWPGIQMQRNVKILSTVIRIFVIVTRWLVLAGVQEHAKRDLF
jgi:hypothetical protein